MSGMSERFLETGTDREEEQILQSGMGADPRSGRRLRDPDGIQRISDPGRIDGETGIEVEKIRNKKYRK